MGLLGNSRSRTALGGSLGTKRTLGGYQLKNKAELAERAQAGVARTASAMSKKGSETKTKTTDLGKASLGVNALALASKVYQTANTPTDFKDMDAAQQNEYISGLSKKAQTVHAENNQQYYKQGVGETGSDKAIDTVTQGSAASGTDSAVTFNSNPAVDAGSGGQIGVDSGLSEGAEAVSQVEAVATGADSVEAIESAVDTTEAIGAALELSDTANATIDTVSAFSYLG